MPDTAHETGPLDRTRIHVIDDDDVNVWAARFGVTPDDVRDAVKAAGDLAEDVKAHLHAHHASNGSDH